MDKSDELNDSNSKTLLHLLQELFSGYMFALHKYNMYREMLFVGFIVLLVLYCTGLMRDLRKGDSESDSDDSDLEEVGLPVEEEEEEDRVYINLLSVYLRNIT